MRIAVVSCAAYRDCWQPFAVLFRKFWPNCQYPLVLVTDEGSDPNYDAVFAYPGAGADSWSERIAAFARESDDPILLFLEDFFLTGPVNTELIEQAQALLYSHKAGCVRLYPCPGSNEDIGDLHFGRVVPRTAYRISTMPAIWSPVYLAQIADGCQSAWSFETDGTPRSNTLTAPVLAFKRDLQPWPLEIMCTGIVRRKWASGTVPFLASHGIAVDSDRETLTA